MESDSRAKADKEWNREEVQVIVATFAFVMGVKKPDVR